MCLPQSITKTSERCKARTEKIKKHSADDNGAEVGPTFTIIRLLENLESVFACVLVVIYEYNSVNES